VDLVLARGVRKEPGPQNRIPAGGPGQPEHPLSTLWPFDILYEADLPAYDLPQDLAEIYGRLGFANHTVYSNFVSSIDGAVSLGSGPSAGSVISGRYPADRFLMALLRACADCVLIGAGTLRATPGHLWTPEHVFPDLASSFARLRKTLGRAPGPRLVVLTATGDLDMSHPAISAGASVLTTRDVATSLRTKLPATCDLIESGVAKVDMGQAIKELRSRKLDVVLTEGGPHVMGELVRQGLLDEAFLTISPVVAGRDAEPRLGMVEGVELLPASGAWVELLSSRRHGDYLFLRYGLRKSAG
jgi:riboflavin biosynthesis pyrimidine reductase